MMLDMLQLYATDPQPLPEPVVTGVLTWAIRLTSPAMCQPGITINSAAQMLTPYLNALPRSCAPELSYAVIMQCPWIDANMASLSNNMWLLDTLAYKLIKAPFFRPMQYRDWDLLDEVSGLGHVQVLEWWHKSDFIIGHTNPMQTATDGGHVAVLQWWLDSGRLGKIYPATGHEEMLRHSLLEPTRMGNVPVLDWWFEHFFMNDLDQGKAVASGTDEEDSDADDFSDSDSDRGRDDLSWFLTHGFEEAIAVACRGMQAGALEWWLDYCMLYLNGITTEIMSVLFAFGNAQGVAKCLAAFLENDGFVHNVVPFACFSGSIEFIEKCLVQFDMVGEMSDSWVEFALYASCAGHVHVLDWLHEKGWVDSSVLNAKVSETNTAVWSIVPDHVAAKLINYLHDKFTLLDCLALQGFVHVMEWWLKFDKEAVQSPFNQQAARARNVEFAFDGNHVAFLDLLLTVFGQAKVDELHEVILTQAIDWGHLEAIQWYWENVDLGGDHGSMVWRQRDIMEDIVAAAFAAEKLDIVEWMTEEWIHKGQSNDPARDIRAIIVTRVLEGELMRHRGLEWIVRNAARLGLTGQVVAKVCHDSENQEIDFQLGPADLWALLGMIGHATPDGSAKFVTAPFLSDDSQLSLYTLWKGYPLFLRHLLSCAGSDIFEYSQLLSELDRGNLLMAALPFDLDRACQAGAGVAVYEWMYSYRSRDPNQATCLWTEEGCQFLMSNQDNCGLKWWKKRGLSTNSDSDDDGSQVQDGSESE